MPTFIKIMLMVASNVHAWIQTDIGLHRLHTGRDNIFFLTFSLGKNNGFFLTFRIIF